MRIAPIIDYAIKVLTIQPIKKIIISDTEGITAFIFQKEPQKPLFEPLAVLCAVFFLCNTRDWCCITVILRFIREKTKQFFAKTCGKTRIILFMRKRKKLPCDVRIQNIDIGI